MWLIMCHVTVGWERSQLSADIHISDTHTHENYLMRMVLKLCWGWVGEGISFAKTPHILSLRLSLTHHYPCPHCCRHVATDFLGEGRSNPATPLFLASPLCHPNFAPLYCPNLERDVRATRAVMDLAAPTSISLSLSICLSKHRSIERLGWQNPSLP